MRIFAIISVCAVLFLISCVWEGKKSTQRLVKKSVFVICVDSNQIQPKAHQPDTSYLNFLFNARGLINIQDMDSSILVKLQYADTSNFLHYNFYDGLKTAYLSCEAALKLCNAQYYLKCIHPNYSLVIFDAARPLHIQQLMWDSLHMPIKEKYQYLSPPNEPSLHNYGCAVDLSIVDLSTGESLDMGSDFDHFGKQSEPSKEKELLKSKVLSETAYNNRQLLRKVMVLAKFKPISTEWWHFSICTKPEAQASFELIE